MNSLDFNFVARPLRLASKKAFNRPMILRLFRIQKPSADAIGIIFSKSQVTVSADGIDAPSPCSFRPSKERFGAGVQIRYRIKSPRIDTLRWDRQEFEE